ncbi:regulator of DNA class I crossover intermediates 1 isoform X2 [Pseudophryne corroboree]|uniref:regulator of DNA class I crossover intermediates 1 isoform X2 n=1 Tax=Pseudophryne corroboree TaxID=495146 RepID=UPI003081F7B7
MYGMIPGPNFRDFFEKKKLKSKLERLELASPKKESVSLDLLSLYVVNQVSRKKEMNKKPQHVDICNTNVLTGRNNAELPMSPITVPSKICLEESEIISSQMPNIEFRINPNTLNCPSNQELNYEEKGDITIEASRRKDFDINFNKKQTKSEMIPAPQYYMYGKCENDSDVSLSKEDIGHVMEIKANPFYLQCSKLHATKMDMFEIQDNWSQTNSNLCKSGKCDMSIECTVARECRCTVCFADCYTNALTNNTANKDHQEAEQTTT